MHLEEWNCARLADTVEEGWSEVSSLSEDMSWNRTGAEESIAAGAEELFLREHSAKPTVTAVL